MLKFQDNVALKNYSTIGIGGPALHFCVCNTREDIVAAIEFAKKNNLKRYFLGQGSNTLFSDAGFDGLVIQVTTKGIKVDPSPGSGKLVCQAGETWDRVVEVAIENDLTGIECLSGIPGLMGAAPMQNIGAYGQEVSQVLDYVEAIDCNSLQTVRFSNIDCNFAYRQSRFKHEDNGRYVIVEVGLKLQSDTEPKILYHELFQFVKSRMRYKTIETNQEKLKALRTAVLEIRRGKSMVIDARDPNSKSLGSFFLNPIVSKEKSAELKAKYPDMPTFNTGDAAKLSAAWLLDHSGYGKGIVHKNVGTSSNHCLAIINRGDGTSTEVLELANLMQTGVRKTFGVEISPEPIINP